MRLSTPLIAVGIVLIVFPEPATSGFGFLLLFVGLLLRFV